MKLKKDKLYKISWVDAYSTNSWTDKNDIDRQIKEAENKPAVCYGLFVKNTKKFYIFTTGYDAEQYFNYFSIPKGWIVEMKEIK